MKKLIAVPALMVIISGNAFAAEYEVGSAVEGGINGASFVYPAGTNFVVNKFTFTLSSQVAFDSLESKSKIAVATGSARGKRAFTGSSEGGSVTTCGDAIGSSFTADDLDELLNLANQNGCEAGSALES